MWFLYKLRIFKTQFEAFKKKAVQDHKYGDFLRYFRTVWNFRKPSERSLHRRRPYNSCMKLAKWLFFTPWKFSRRRGDVKRQLHIMKNSLILLLLRWSTTAFRKPFRIRNKLLKVKCIIGVSGLLLKIRQPPLKMQWFCVWGTAQRKKTANELLRLQNKILYHFFLVAGV